MSRLGAIAAGAVFALGLLAGHGGGQGSQGTDTARVRVTPLRTGTAYRFKGLAVDPIGGRLFLGSWDKKQIVSVPIGGGAATELASPFQGRLNGMGVALQHGLLYAAMNEVDDTRGATPCSALVIFDARTGKFQRSYVIRGDSSGRHHFNHVVVDDSGRAYISNTLKGGIWSVNPRSPTDSLRPFITHPKLRLVHGITLDPTRRRLYVTSYEAGLGAIDLGSAAYTSLNVAESKGNDGLRYYRGALYGVGQNTLTRYTLDAAGARVVITDVLLKDHPYFNDPRVIDVVGDSLFILGNIEHAPVSFRSGPPRRDALTDTYILRYRLSKR